MTLKAALSANKKNNGLFLQHKDKFYYVPSSASYYQGIPQEAVLHGGDDWSHGFAWLCWDNRALVVSLPNLTSRHWKTVDGSEVYASHEAPERFLQGLVEKRDEANKYNPDKSEYGKMLLERCNKLLEKEGSPCRVYFQPSTFHTMYFALDTPAGAHPSEQFKATKLVCDLAKSIDDEEDARKERELFDANKPSAEIRVKKVSMTEFLERVQKSDKLWHLDATNAWNRDKTGQGRSRNWTKASLSPVKLVRSNYGGARTDRIASRNSLTNAIGLPECKGRMFYTLDDKRGFGGHVFADAVHHYGANGDSIIIDDCELLDLRHNITHNDPNPSLGYGQLNPDTKRKSYKSIVKILNTRLADFESYNK